MTVSYAFSRKLVDGKFSPRTDDTVIVRSLPVMFLIAQAIVVPLGMVCGPTLVRLIRSASEPTANS